MSRLKCGCLLIASKMDIWIFGSFYNNSKIKNDFTKYVKESSCLCFVKCLQIYLKLCLSLKNSIKIARLFLATVSINRLAHSSLETLTSVDILQKITMEGSMYSQNI